MKKSYQALAMLIAASVIVQAASVALYVFTLFADADAGVAIDSDYANAGIWIHRIFGLGVVPLLAIALLVVAFMTKIRGAARLAGLVFGLVVLQIVLAIAAFGIPSVGVLHAVNAFAVAGVASVAARRIGQAVPAKLPTAA